MKKKEALEQGLEFTGCYVRRYDKDQAVKRVAELKKSGYKAVLVEEESVVLVYADCKYFEDEELEHIEILLSNQDKVREGIRAKYEAEMTAYNNRIWTAENRKADILESRK